MPEIWPPPTPAAPASSTNVAALVAHTAQRDPQRLAIRFEGRDITYGELAARAQGMAHHIAAAGVGAGARVAVLIPNVPAWIEAYLATLSLGAVAVALSPAWTASEVGTVLAHAEPALVIIHEALVDRLASNQHRAQVLTAGDSGLLGTDDDWGTASELSVTTVGRDSPVAILYSSGTTGTPRGVMLSHSNVTGCARAKAAYCGITEADRLALFVPLAHCYGQNAVLNAAFAAGAAVVLQRRFDTGEVLRSVDADGTTMIFGVPLIFQRLMDSGEHDILRRTRYALSAATTLPATLAQAWLDTFGRPIYEAYGLTETSPFACYNHLTEYRADTVGTAIRGVRVRIADVESGAEVGRGVRGEIQICGPNVMLGYWRDTAATAAAIQDGWLRSGDIGTMDEDGYIRVVDRLKDMINVSGLKAYPTEIEQVLLLHAAVAEAAVFAGHDPERGERVEAALVLRADAAPVEPAAVEAHCRTHLAAYKVPRAFHWVDALPRNGTGKVLRRMLRDQYFQTQPPSSGEAFIC